MRKKSLYAERTGGAQVPGQKRRLCLGKALGSGMWGGCRERPGRVAVVQLL